MGTHSSCMKIQTELSYKHIPTSNKKVNTIKKSSNAPNWPSFVSKINKKLLTPSITQSEKLSTQAKKNTNMKYGLQTGTKRRDSTSIQNSIIYTDNDLSMSIEDGARSTLRSDVGVFDVITNRTGTRNDAYDTDIDIESDIESNINIKLHELITSGFIFKTFGRSRSVPSNIILLCRQYYYSSKALRRKRVIFTSMNMLNLCIDSIPKYILEESLFLFRIRNDNLLSQTDDITKINKYSTGLQSIFIKYLIRKSKQGKLLLMDNNTSWNDISHKLCNIHDIYYNENTDKCYNKLLLRSIYWINNQDCIKFIHHTNTNEILSEIIHNTLKFQPTMEILYQSNNTMIPMTIFNIEQYHLYNGFNNDYIQTYLLTYSPVDTICIPLELQLNDTISNSYDYSFLSDYDNDDDNNADHKLVFLPSYNAGQYTEDSDHDQHNCVTATITTTNGDRNANNDDLKLNNSLNIHPLLIMSPRFGSHTVQQSTVPNNKSLEISNIKNDCCNLCHLYQNRNNRNDNNTSK